MRTPRTSVTLAVLSLALTASLRAQVAETPRLFVGREAEIEEYLRTAEVVKYQDIALGVTRPTRAWLTPGGPVGSVAWKPLRPGLYRGFQESYKSEIAAYEMDKLLQLHMVPPTVERKIDGITGAVIMWLDNMRMWRDLKSRKPGTRQWNAQMVRMKMFDALIGNIDRNAGNILVDESWTVYLIDHSRAFVEEKEPPGTFTLVDAALWDRMQALDEPTLTQAVGQWVTPKCVTAMLTRRDRMAKNIAKLVEKRGEVRVFLRE
jgi:hypothetical protein